MVVSTGVKILVYAARVAIVFVHFFQEKVVYSILGEVV